MCGNNFKLQNSPSEDKVNTFKKETHYELMGPDKPNFSFISIFVSLKFFHMCLISRKIK